METFRMVVEIAFFAVAIYLVLRFRRDTRGSGVIRGLSIILITATFFYIVVTEVFELTRIRMVFNLLAETTVLGLIIVFHPEIRRAIVSLGDSPLFGNLIKPEVNVLQRVLRAVARMQKDRVGALIAFERQAALSTYIENGIKLDAEVNSALLESIFYPGSALHDGAVIIRNDRIAAASCILPLSDKPGISERLGTRHRAALGLSEETDAFTIVVSEETGNVSVGVAGTLYYAIELEKLEEMMVATLRPRKNR